MKPVLMIHEFKEEFLDLPLEDYILTFDDGLYTQYKFFDKIKKIDTEKYFFISSDIVCDEDKSQDDSFISCYEAHKKAFNGDYSNYMKWSQIRELQCDDKSHIGCHSHYHKINTADCIECIIEDNRKMIFEFIKNLTYLPSYFCFPYNHETLTYKEILKRKGFKKFFGKERIDINDL